MYMRTLNYQSLFIHSDPFVIYHFVVFYCYVVELLFMNIRHCSTYRSDLFSAEMIFLSLYLDCCPFSMSFIFLCDLDRIHHVPR